jgi:hypothetical protein
MRKTILAAVAVAALGFAGSAAVSAAPVYGTSLGTAAATLDLTQNVRWWHRGFVRHGWWCARHPFRC